MTTTLPPYRSQLHPTRAGFAHLLRAEWTKFWTVRAWLLVLVLAAAVTVVISQLGAGGSVTDGPDPVTGPDGTVVNDAFRTTHRPLTGDGTITVHVTSLKSADGRPVEDWAKAGLILKENLEQGSAYTAVMTTPGHGVRTQWNFTHDEAGSADADRLRLTREGDEITSYESTDGRSWTKLTTVRLEDLPETVEVGAFVATPSHQVLRRSFGGTSVTAGGGTVTGTFEDLTLEGTSTATDWTSTDVRGSMPTGPAQQDAEPGSTQVTSGGYALTGRGDIAPDETRGDTVQMSFQGVFVGVLFMIALGALFMTSEYKRGLIRTTFTVTPGRVRVLAAKVTVIATVTFAAALAATTVAFPLAQSTLRANGYEPPGYPDYSLLDPTALRAIVGCALLLSLVAVLALGLGVVLRSSAGAITVAVVLVILPQILSYALPVGAGEWLLRLTPAAAFAIEQGVTRYAFVDNNCLPEAGCYPLSPWSGLTVLAVYALAVLLLAAWRLRRRDT